MELMLTCYMLYYNKFYSADGLEISGHDFSDTSDNRTTRGFDQKLSKTKIKVD